MIHVKHCLLEKYFLLFIVLQEIRRNSCSEKRHLLVVWWCVFAGFVQNGHCPYACEIVREIFAWIKNVAYFVMQLLVLQVFPSWRGKHFSTEYCDTVEMSYLYILYSLLLLLFIQMCIWCFNLWVWICLLSMFSTLTLFLLHCPWVSELCTSHRNRQL